MSTSLPLTGGLCRAERFDGLSALIIGAGQVGAAVGALLLERGVARLCLHTLSKGELVRALAEVANTKVDVRSAELWMSWGDLFRPGEATVGIERSDGVVLEGRGHRRLLWLTDHFKPDLVVDATNSATTLAQAGTSSRHGDKRARGLIGRALDANRRFYVDVLEMLTTRAVRKYVKVSTTALGGLGLDMKFTHGDAPESVLSRATWLKLFISGAQHQITWAIARAHDGSVSVVIPAACVGFEGLEVLTVRDNSGYTFPVVRAGENSVYALQELLALTGPGQMSVITKEEVASHVLHCLGHGCLYDMIRALETTAMWGTEEGRSARDSVVARLRETEVSQGVRSVATGNLGPAVAAALLELSVILSLVAHPSWRGLANADPSHLAAVLADDPTLCGFIAPQAREAGLAVVQPNQEAGEAQNLTDHFVDLRLKRLEMWVAFAREVASNIDSELASDHVDEGAILARYLANAPKWV